MKIALTRLACGLLGFCLSLGGLGSLGATADFITSTNRFQTIVLEDQQPPITVHLAWCDGPVSISRRPVILMLGSIEPQKLPAWSTNLVQEGFMLAAFSTAHPPDPNPQRRPVWLHFDERFAHSYALGSARAINDAGRVMGYLVNRPDIAADKIGWLGSSSTAIPGLAVVTQGPRLAAFVGYVCTGAYEQWFDTWREHGLWRSGTNELWPETRALLLRHDPIRFATNAFPTAVLMVSGGSDTVVDPKTARAFVEAARSAYASDPNRLRLVVYDGFTHNLPSDVVQHYAEHWFRLYLHPTRPPPGPAAVPANLDQSVQRSQINAADHRGLVGAAKPNANAGATNAPDWIRVAPAGHGFVNAQTGRAFTPWGFNYDRDHRKRLLEEYWESEWSLVAADFREMQALGASYNLMNEPLVPAQPRKPGDWLVGQLDQLWYVQAITLDPTGRARAGLARDWTAMMAKSIRAEDQRHLIPVGLLPNSADATGGSGFEPARIASELDFVSVHLYPKRGELADARETLQKFQVGKPLVVEETFPLHCGIEELVQLIRDPQTSVAGWMSFYWGQTLDELAAGKTMAEAVTGQWLRSFCGTAPSLKQGGAGKP